MDQKLFDTLCQRKIKEDALGIKKYKESDLELMMLVSKELDKFNVRNINLQIVDIPFDVSILRSVQTLKIYNNSLINRVSNTFKNSSWRLETPPCRPMVNICFSQVIDDYGNEYIDKLSGRVAYFSTSDKICKSDFIWYAHEGIHSLKDIYYEEYIRMNRFGDVLPLVHELIVKDNLEKSIYNEWLCVRYNLLKESCKEIKLGLKCKKDDINNSDIYDILIGTSGQYLVSFYYAIILYKMYLKNHSILNEINSVLMGQQTTEMLLSNLDILESNSKLNKMFRNENKKLVKTL